MGRPRKRMREGDAESDENGNVAASTDMMCDTVVDLDMSSYRNLATITPQQQLHDSTFPLGSFSQSDGYLNESHVSPFSATE